MDVYTITRIQLGWGTHTIERRGLVTIEHETPDDWAFNHAEYVLDQMETSNPGQDIDVLVSVFEQDSDRRLASREASNVSDDGGFQAAASCRAALRQTGEACTWEEDFPFMVEEDEIVMSNKGYAIVVMVL